MNDIWEDFKRKFFKSANPAMIYIGINICVFAVTGIFYIVSLFMGTRGLTNAFFNQYFAFPADLLQLPFRFYTLITHAFIHVDIFLFLFNMLWLFWMGQIFMDFLKPRQFHMVYWGGVVSGALFFALMFNLIPAFLPTAGLAALTGSSAAVMAVFAAVVTLVPNYSIGLLFIGQIKLKWLLLIYIFFNLFMAVQTPFQTGVSLSHFGGILFGFVFIKLLQNGTDLSALFKSKPKLKVIKNHRPNKKTTFANQAEIDRILDKISKSGYQKLTAKEKKTLFDTNKN